MNNLVKSFVLILFVWLQLLVFNLQSDQAQGPLPGDLSQVQILRLPPVDVQRLLQEDQQRAIQRLPLRFAQPITVQVSPARHGAWDQLDANTRRWRLRIISADARSLNLGFSRYVMPAGGRLVIYTPNHQQTIGPFTSEDNETHGQLWTPLLASDDIIIDVTLPAEAASQLELELTSVNYGYAEFGQASPDKSGSCNIDVICPAGDNWRDEIRSAARYTISGSIICSGSLVNNTTQDLTPYFLTANHCGGGIDAVNAPSMVVYWNYETSICGGTPDGSLTQFNTGAIFRAAYSASDFALVELDDPIDAAFNIYWAGWDNSSADPINATTIHHPSGDEKRISFENDPTTTTSYLNTAVPGDGTHLRITDWDSGTTEPGSSGSPLFNQNKLVVGQLHGGVAACSNNSSDWYGRLSVSWAGGGAADSRLSDWLDPGNTGLTALNGTDVLNVTPASLNVCVPTAAIYTIRVNPSLAFTGPVTLSVSGQPQGTGLTLSQNPVTPPATSVLTVTNPSSISGSYNLSVTAMSATGTYTNTVGLNYIDQPGAVSLTSPAQDAANQPLIPQFEWSAATQATTYTLEIASDSAFNSIVYSATVIGTSHRVTSSLMSNTSYYWRVTPHNSCGAGQASTIFSFTTLQPDCRTPNLTIPDNDANGVVDTMVISESGTIVHLNASISAAHTWVGDLTFVLEHVDTGTSVTLIERPGGPSCSGDDLDVLLEDQATAAVQTECGAGVPAVSGILSPKEPLSAFEGEDRSGTWQLIASDNGFITSGTLVEWCLQPAVNTTVSDTVYLPTVLKNGP